MKYFMDTEFIEDGSTIDLISIGIVSEDGRAFYRESLECDVSKACPWVTEHVISQINALGVTPVTRKQIAVDLLAFIGDDPKPEFWAYYGAYDWVALCQLYGRMIDLPKGWPMHCHDLKQLAGDIRLIEQTTPKHHALDDARWTKEAYDNFQQWLETGRRLLAAGAA